MKQGQIFSGFLAFIFCVFLSAPSFSDDWLYTVRPNDTARSISNKYLMNPYRFDWILQYNNLSLESAVKPGVVLKFPLDSLKFGPARVNILAVQGDVQLIRDAKSETLSNVHSLRLGDSIITGAESAVTLLFADKSEVLLGENSELIFDVLTRWGRTGMVDSRMRLIKGNVEGRVNKLNGPGAHFEVHTPSAVATVRGTEFRVRVDGENSNVSFNEVSEGRVQVENNVSANLVPDGFGLIAEAGKVSSPPVELLPAPILENPVTDFPSPPVSFDWQANNKAKGYRVERFLGDGFKKQLDSRALVNPQLALNDLDAGTYSLRIRAIDNDGLEGLNQNHKFTLGGAPMAPDLQNTQTRYLLNQPVFLEWSASKNALTYQLEVAKDFAFTELVGSEKMASTNYNFKKTLAPGQYFWRLRGVNQEGAGQVSKKAIFMVTLPEIPTVNTILDRDTEQPLEISWEPVPFSNSYHWQLAKDSAFENIVQENNTMDTEIDLKTVKEGHYYFRVAVKSEHNMGRYSQVYQFKVTKP